MLLARKLVNSSQREKGERRLGGHFAEAAVRFSRDLLSSEQPNVDDAGPGYCFRHADQNLKCRVNTVKSTWKHTIGEYNTSKNTPTQ